MPRLGIEGVTASSRSFLLAWEGHVQPSMYSRLPSQLACAARHCVSSPASGAKAPAPLLCRLPALPAKRETTGPRVMRPPLIENAVGREGAVVGFAHFEDLAHNALRALAQERGATVVGRAFG